MKKISTLLFSAGLLAFAAGCTSSEIIDEGAPELRGAISFGTTNVSKPSRAALDGGVSVSNTNLTDFYVYGSYTKSQGSINVFNGVKTTKTTNAQPGANEWKYDGGDRFWVPGATYTFAAFSCSNFDDANNAGVPAYAEYKDGVLGFKDYVCHNHDLVYAYTDAIEGKETGNQAVNLQFKHILTRLKFSFECKTPGSDYTIELSEVKLSGMINSADFNGGSRKWENHVTNNTQVAVEDLSIVGTSNVVPDNTGVDAEDQKTYLEYTPIFVIPNTYAEKNVVNLTFKMTVKHETETILDRNVIATWVPNGSRVKA